VRLGLLPGLCVLAVLIAGLFGHRSGSGSDPAGTVSAADIHLNASETRARDVVLSTKDLAVPVHPETLLMMPDRTRNNGTFFFVAFNQPSELPPGTTYQMMSCPQALAAFLKTSGHPKDVLAVGGANGTRINRSSGGVIAKTIPASEPPSSAPLTR